MHWHILDWASFSSKYQNFRFFSRLMRAAKVQTRLCIGINSTEPSLLENAIRTTFPVLFSHSLINASSECSGKTAHYYKLIWDFVNVSKNVELANCCQKPLTLAQARLIDRCLAVVKFVSGLFELTEISTRESARDQTGPKSLLIYYIAVLTI